MINRKLGKGQISFSRLEGAMPVVGILHIDSSPSMPSPVDPRPHIG